MTDCGNSLRVVVAVNRDDVLSQNLLRSPDVVCGGVPVIEERGHASAGAAYDHWLAKAVDAEIIAYVHQDVYLPEGWMDRLRSAIQELEAKDPQWAVLGVFGLDKNQELIGELWDNGRRRPIGYRPAHVQEAIAIDEVVIVLRIAAGIRFDLNLPGFHLYAADLVQSARTRGMRTYVFDGPVVHNNVLIGQLDGSYRAAYRYMSRKWRSALPIPTCVMPVTRFGWPLARRWLRIIKRDLLGRTRPQPRDEAPELRARQLGYHLERREDQDREGMLPVTDHPKAEAVRCG